MAEKIVKQQEWFRRSASDAAMEVRQEEGATQKSLRFSATSQSAQVERWFGIEVLSHDRGAVNLGRANGGAMPLLFNHNINDPIGMITHAMITDQRMIVDAVFFDTPRAQEIQTMIAGGLRNVSTAYRVNTLEEDKKTGIFTVNDWEPFEVSIVTVPADASVGIGRGMETTYDMRMITPDPQPATTVVAQIKERAMTPEEELAAAERASKQTLSGVQMEERRKKAIGDLCSMNKLDDKYRDMWIGQGLSVEDVTADMLLVIQKRGESNPVSSAKLGLTPNESKDFSLVRAINAVAHSNWHDAPFELECSREISKRLGKSPDPNKFYVPFEVLHRPMTDEQRMAAAIRSGRRDLTVASSGGGGYLVGTQNVGFIGLMRNRSVAFRMGATRLSGLKDNITIPRMSAAGTVYWLATEATAATESQQTFQQVPLSPKTAAAYTEISRQLLLQSSPGAEGIVTDDLAQITALAADLAVLNGSGSAGQPQGIIQAGIGTVAAGSLNYDAILECQNDLATANVMPSAGGYVTTPTVAKLAMTRVKFASTATPLWEGNIWDGQMSGFPSMSSNQMPAATLLFGDWAEVVVAEWGVLEVEVNPYANFQAGIVGVRAMYSLDVALRRPFAFTVMQTIS